MDLFKLAVGPQTFVFNPGAWGSLILLSGQHCVLHLLHLHTVAGLINQ